MPTCRSIFIDVIGVTNQFGRQLRFVYDSSRRIVQVLPPAALKDGATGSNQAPIRYAYDTFGNLASVTWQDGSIKRYHYEDMRFTAHLTGITDELGVRIGTYAYDAQGRATSSEGAAGTERYVFRYDSGAQTSVTAPDGSARIYGFSINNGVSRPTSVSAPCPLCGVTNKSTVYGDGATVNGGEGARSQPTKTVAHDASVTFTSYDSKGRVTEKALFAAGFASNSSRPALSAATSVTSTQWHPTWSLPMQTAEPGKLTTYTYDASGNLTGQSWTATTDGIGASAFSATRTGSTYASGWAYDANGLNITALEMTDSVETRRWTMVHNALGDVTSVTDVRNNRTATMASYDAHGRMLTGSNDMGVPIAFTYAPRGFVSSKSVNAQTVRFTQNVIGLTTQVAMPDGQVLGYTYDPAHRLTDIKLNGVSITSAMLASADYPDTLLKARWAQLKRGVQDGVEGLITSAWAQTTGGLLRPVPIVPGQPMPGQPEFDPRRDMMMMAPMSDSDKQVRAYQEAFARWCECDPNSGYGKPTFTAKTFAHVFYGGHTMAMFSDKSYFDFSTKVGQALVDEVVAREAFGRKRRVGARDEYIVPMGRMIGMTRVKNAPGFVPTDSILLIVERNNCSGPWKFNEVVTIHPIESRP